MRSVLQLRFGCMCLCAVHLLLATFLLSVGELCPMRWLRCNKNGCDPWPPCGDGCLVLRRGIHVCCQRRAWHSRGLRPEMQPERALLLVCGRRRGGAPLVLSEPVATGQRSVRSIQKWWWGASARELDRECARLLCDREYWVEWCARGEWCRGA